MSPEDGTTVGIDFTEGNGAHPGSFESKAKSADAAE